jgi:hypothetical protein
MSETNPSASAKENANALKSTPHFYPQITQISADLRDYFWTYLMFHFNQRKIKK